ncbi:hypothetical protein NMY22_g17025 [Coprinellus aureogranulatus]|nr:hypothetical protein NMY22_g17025 [Coprinellus aureogranulatus]
MHNLLRPRRLAGSAKCPCTNDVRDSTVPGYARLGIWRDLARKREEKRETDPRRRRKFKTSSSDSHSASYASLIPHILPSLFSSLSSFSSFSSFSSCSLSLSSVFCLRPPSFRFRLLLDTPISVLSLSGLPRRWGRVSAPMLSPPARHAGQTRPRSLCTDGNERRRFKAWPSSTKAGAAGCLVLLQGRIRWDLKQFIIVQLVLHRYIFPLSGIRIRPTFQLSFHRHVSQLSVEIHVPLAFFRRSVNLNRIRRLRLVSSRIIHYFDITIRTTRVIHYFDIAIRTHPLPRRWLVWQRPPTPSFSFSFVLHLIFLQPSAIQSSRLTPYTLFLISFYFSLSQG